MLSLFPEILFLAPFSALLLRLSLAAVLAYAAWQHVGAIDKTVRALSFIEAALAVVILVGAWTQAAALLVILFLGLHLFIPRMRVYETSTILLALVMCLSLLVTGAGALAFDLPL